MDSLALIALDPLLTELVGGNVITIFAGYKLLKGVARVTPWAWDDSLPSLFLGFFKTFNPTIDKGK